jgi:1,4-alpha-glucan branching enzyme
VAAFARDPKASAQVWSRHGGYPGDGAYLDFHKIRWPGGLKYWRVTGSSVDMGAKEPYDPPTAAAHADAHAAHFARLIDALAADEPRKSPAVLAAPFDTELFGHWWFEGPHFLEETYRLLPGHPDVHPSTASAHLQMHPPAGALRLPSGSWGANGNFSMWLNEQTAWTWERLWPLEESFWDVAPSALTDPLKRTVLEQATRELLLAQSSDWQFIISTGAVTDYAFRRFNGHCDEAERLVSALRPGHESELPAALRLAEESRQRDDLFPDPLPAVEAALAGTRTLALG